MKPSVLIADSDAELCEFYRHFLGEQGYEVAIAADGLDCLEKLRRLRPAALVRDLGLRWGGGDGVLAWPREESAGPEVAVVLTATNGCHPGRAEDGPGACDPEGLRRRGAAHVIAKPFRLEQLADALRRLVQAVHADLLLADNGPTREGRVMLALTRRAGEEIVSADNIRVTVVMVNGQTVRLGITAPPSVPVVRQGLLAACPEGARSATNGRHFPRRP
jgi:carbon storage regulator